MHLAHCRFNMSVRRCRGRIGVLPTTKARGRRSGKSPLRCPVRRTRRVNTYAHIQVGCPSFPEPPAILLDLKGKAKKSRSLGTSEKIDLRLPTALRLDSARHRSPGTLTLAKARGIPIASCWNPMAVVSWLGQPNCGAAGAVSLSSKLNC
jgi:hypothetical protein